MKIQWLSDDKLINLSVKISLENLDIGISFGAKVIISEDWRLQQTQWSRNNPPVFDKTHSTSEGDPYQLSGLEISVKNCPIVLMSSALVLYNEEAQNLTRPDKSNLRWKFYWDKYLYLQSTQIAILKNFPLQNVRDWMSFSIAFISQ